MKMYNRVQSLLDRNGNEKADASEGLVYFKDRADGKI